jgi:tol-pal system protein YbgF
MKKLVAVAALVLGGCASAPAPDEPQRSSAPATSTVADARLGEMQTAMTELLERLDVVSDRLARLEEQRAIAAAPAPQPVPQPVQIIVPAPPPITENTAGRPVSAVAPPPVQVSRALAGAQLADDYRAAIVLYGKGRVKEARQAFQDVFDSDPGGELADNALYWIGETYFAANDFQNAMRYYRRVATDFGDQNKAPDALYKMGLALAKTGDLALARKTLEEVIAKYPYSSPAASSKQELKRIKY